MDGSSKRNKKNTFKPVLFVPKDKRIVVMFSDDLSKDKD